MGLSVSGLEAAKAAELQAGKTFPTEGERLYVFCRRWNVEQEERSTQQSGSFSRDKGTRECPGTRASERRDEAGSARSSVPCHVCSCPSNSHACLMQCSKQGGR